jgi:hypothetical protein
VIHDVAVLISTPKKTPVIGALNVAEMPPAAPQATMIRSRFSGSRTHCPMLEASAEPIWTIGPSRPAAMPPPARVRQPVIASYNICIMHHRLPHTIDL